MPNFELPVKFSDNETVVIKEGDLVLKVPVLARAVNVETEEDLNKDIVETTAVEVPFPSAAGKFLFDHVKEYTLADEQRPSGNYEAAAEKSLLELRDILELGNYFETLNFVKVIGFVIAGKLADKSVEEIAEFMGLEVLAEPDGWDEDHEWMGEPIVQP